MNKNGKSKGDILPRDDPNEYCINGGGDFEDDHDRTRIPYNSKQQPGQQDEEYDDDDDGSDGEGGAGSENESVLSEISNESTYFENKIGFQRRALFRKNATL